MGTEEQLRVMGAGSTESNTAASRPLLTTLGAATGLLAAEGASLGLAAWCLRVGTLRTLVYGAKNEISPRGRTLVIADMAIGAAIAVTLGVLIAAVLRRRGGPELAERLGRRAAPLMLVGWLPFLFNVLLWPGHELTLLVLISVFGFALALLVRLALVTAPVLDDLAPRRFVLPALARARGAARRVRDALARARWLPWSLVVVAIVVYVIHFSYHTLNTHYRLGTAAYDLGVESNVVWNALHWGPLFKASPIGGADAVYTGLHQPYFAYLLAPIYALAPRAQTLLVIQSAMIALAALPLFVVARRRLGAGIACLLALAYLLYPAVHGSNLYDFHYQPLSVFFLFTTLCFIEARRPVLAAICTLLGFSLREDISSLFAVLGLYLVLTAQRPRAGAVLIVAGCLYFGVLKFLVMPRFLGGAQAYADQYKSLIGPGEQGFGGVLKTVIANPFFTLTTLLERDKLIYVLQLFAPLAFVPLRRPIGLLLCIPGFFYVLLATEYWPLTQISFQYTAYWTPFLFIGTIAVLDQLGERECAGLIAAATRRSLVVALAGAMLVSSYQFGAILNKTNTRGGFGAYRFGLTAQDELRHANAYALIAEVPPAAKLAASEMLVAHVSSRPDVYTLRNGIFDAEYLLFEIPPRADERPWILQALGGPFGVVDVRGEFVLARRGHTTQRNREALKLLGVAAS